MARPPFASSITSSKPLTDLLLQRFEVCQILFVPLMDLAGNVVGCGGFCTHQCIGAAAALSGMRQVALVALNYLMEMPAAVFPHGKTMNGLVGIGQKAAQFATVAAPA